MESNKHDVFMKIKDVGNKSTNRKRNALFALYLLLMILSFVLTVSLNIDKFLFFWGLLFLTLAFIVIISNVLKEMKLINIFITKTNVLLASEDFLNEISIDEILTIKKSNPGIILIEMTNGKKQIIRTDLRGSAKFLSNLMSNERLRSKFDFNSIS